MGAFTHWWRNNILQLGNTTSPRQNLSIIHCIYIILNSRAWWIFIRLPTYSMYKCILLEFISYHFVMWHVKHLSNLKIHSYSTASALRWTTVLKFLHLHWLLQCSATTTWTWCAVHCIELQWKIIDTSVTQLCCSDAAVLQRSVNGP